MTSRVPQALIHLRVPSKIWIYRQRFLSYIEAVSHILKTGESHSWLQSMTIIVILTCQANSVLSRAFALSLIGQGVILDRSVFSDQVFAIANLKDGNISKKGALIIGLKQK